MLKVNESKMFNITCIFYIFIQLSWRWYGSWIYNYLQSVSITNKVVNLKSAHDKVFSIQHYLLKFVSDLRQVSGFFHQ